MVERISDKDEADGSIPSARTGLYIINIAIVSYFFLLIPILTLEGLFAMIFAVADSFDHFMRSQIKFSKLHDLLCRAT